MKSTRIQCGLFVLAIAFATAPVFGAATDRTENQQVLKQRVVGPQMQWTVEATENFDPSWIHVKFVEGSDVELQQAPTPDTVPGFMGEQNELLQAVNAILQDAAEINRSFPGERDYYRNLKAKGEAASGAVGPDLSLWYTVRITDDRQGLVDKINALNELDIVEIAHPAPICDTAGMFDIQLLDPILFTIGGMVPVGGTPDYTAQQDYLYDTPLDSTHPAHGKKVAVVVRT